MDKTTSKIDITTFEFKSLNNQNQKVKVYDVRNEIKKNNELLVKPHRTDFFGFVFITQGTGTHIINYEKIEVKVGDVIVVFPGQIHAFDNTELLKCKAIAFEEDLFLSTHNQLETQYIYEILNQLSRVNVLSINKSVIKKLIKLIDLIEQETAVKNDENQQFILQHLVTTLIYDLNRQISKQENITLSSFDKNLAIQFKSLVRKHLHIKNNVDFFISKLKTTKKALQKATKSTFNMTPKMTIAEQITLESKRLLINPDKQIQEVAYELGFDEPTNFTKFFKKFTSLTPEAFRKKQHDLTKGLAFNYINN